MAQRRFLIASSLARLIRKEQGIASRIVEGYFPARPDWDHFVSLEPGHCFLVLTTTKEHAELKRDQILAYGKDDHIRGCTGSMHSTIEAVG